MTPGIRNLAPHDTPPPPHFGQHTMPFTPPHNPEPSAATPDVIVENNGFYPAISLLGFRSAMRVDAVTTPERAEHAIKDAMATVNHELLVFQVEALNSGYLALERVPLRAHMFAGQYEYKYFRAVYSLAKANLIERYRDSDTTKHGNDRADQLEHTGDDYRRDAHFAIADIVDRPRTTVELI